jgi:acetylornithine deacetylase/succinyl-diaminopimelate desuccinylase-like protein
MTQPHDRDKETIDLTSAYIRINTTNPPGNETAAASFFAEIFKREGIVHTVWESKPGRGSIMARINRDPGAKAPDPGPLMLMHHSDVVPADPSEWSFDPFGGEVRDGYVCGRGTLDTKGLGIMELMAFLAVKREGLKPIRDLVFLACADEEMGADWGADWLFKHHYDEIKASLVINEGGIGVSDLIGGKDLHMVATGEKGLCWLELVRTGPPGHGSTPHGQNSLEKLNLALVRLLSTPIPYDVKPAVAEYFRNLARGWDFLKPFGDDGKPETLIRLLTETGLIANPQLSAMLKNTISLNVMKAGDKTNSIPGRSVAHLDTRLLPGDDMKAFVAWIKKTLADDEIEINYLHTSAANQSPFDTEPYRIITEIMERHYPGSVVTPSLLTGGSDSRFYRDKGVPTYGIFPAVVPMADVTGMIHGMDEKISVDNMITGTQVITDIVKRLCT